MENELGLKTRIAADFIMKKLVYLTLVALFMLQLAACSGGQKEVLLFSYFTGNGEDGLHLGSSTDGYTWTAVNGGKPLLNPLDGENNIMRDPCIIKGPDEFYHLVWTANWRCKGIGYARSADLINWTDKKYISLMDYEPEARNCWAPELFYDSKKEQYLIYWSSSIPGRFAETDSSEDHGSNHRIYCTTTKDFKTFAETRLFFDQGFNVIDATIVEDAGQYAMFVKNETQYPVAEKNIRICFSNDLYGMFSDVSSPITRNWVEGPTTLRTDSGMVLYYDIYREKKMGAVYSADLKNWTDVSTKISFPEGTKHGTVFKVNEAIFEKLKNLYYF